MAFTDILLEQGYVPKGVRPKTIPAGGGQARWQDNSTTGRLLQNLVEYQETQRKEEERRQEEMQNKADMYKTLRESGYSPEKAFGAVSKGKWPDEAGGEIETKKTQAEKFRTSLTATKKGEMTIDELKDEYPDKSIREESPIGRVGKYLKGEKLKKEDLPNQLIPVKHHQVLARMKRTHAVLDAPTAKEVKGIKSYGDLLNFLERVDELEEEGVNVDTIQEYYKEAIEKLLERGLIEEE